MCRREGRESRGGSMAKGEEEKRDRNEGRR